MYRTWQIYSKERHEIYIWKVYRDGCNENIEVAEIKNTESIRTI